MSNDSHLSLVKPDVAEPRTHPALPKWSPLIAPATPPSGPGDDEDDDDFEDVGTIVQRRTPRGQQEHRVYGDASESLHKRLGAELLSQALGELAGVRRRYAHLDALKPVFAAVEQVFAQSAEPDEARLRAAVSYGRQAMVREGLDTRTAAERAAELHGVRLADVLEQLRARVVSEVEENLLPSERRGPAHCAAGSCWRQAVVGERYCPKHARAAGMAE